jgi:hypothetical protein
MIAAHQGPYVAAAEKDAINAYLTGALGILVLSLLFYEMWLAALPLLVRGARRPFLD